MEDHSQVARALQGICDRALPRILTQICRDPGAATYGSCDRNWWHYKIRDFPSVILQQAGYTVAVAAADQSDPGASRALRLLSAATCRFWNARATRHGAFEEYYPYEQGYPPLAFSTLAVARTCSEGLVSLAEVEPGLSRATRQLLSRFEGAAGNQQVAGTAALALVRGIAPHLVPTPAFDRLLDQTLSLQTEEGWFPEYEGPDLGYLSVTLDCLWDLFDATGDSRVHTAIVKAFDFLTWFVMEANGGAGMHNSRNTDYIVPYGIARLASEPEQAGRLAAAALQRLYHPDSPHRCDFDAVDDRYWCHYIGTSMFRATQVLRHVPERSSLESGEARPVAAHAMALSGHVQWPSTSPSCPAVLVSTRKGGVVTARWPGGEYASDFGWIVKTRGRTYVSHWWTPRWEVLTKPGEAGCDGWLVRHVDHTSVPWKHMALRVASYFLGHRMVPLLKRLLIYRRADTAYTFSRRVRLQGNQVVVEDCIGGLRSDDGVLRAPRMSKRHVASADSFHVEDILPVFGVSMREEVVRSGHCWRVITTYDASAADTTAAPERLTPHR